MAVVMIIVLNLYTCMHAHTTIWQPSRILSRTTQVSWHQNGKTNLDLLEQEIVSGSGISWAICKSAPWPRHITMPAWHHSIFFTGRMPFLPPNQQYQSTEDKVQGNLSWFQWCQSTSQSQTFCKHKHIFCNDDGELLLPDVFSQCDLTVTVILTFL